MAGRTPALQQNWQSSEKSKHLRKNTVFNKHPVSSATDIPVTNIPEALCRQVELNFIYVF